MPEAGIEFLAPRKIQSVVTKIDAALQAQKDDNLLFLGRTPQVRAFDDEIRGRFSGKTYAADVITDDSEALTYDAGKFEFFVSSVPKLKLGAHFSETLLRALSRYKQAPLPQDTGLLGDSIAKVLGNLVKGIRIRKNAMICAMQLDAWNYNRFGIKIADASWGMPADLKVTASTAYSTAASATPITEILVLNEETAKDNYGVRFDRITMSTRVLRAIIATAEFQSFYKGLYQGPVLDGAVLNTHNLAAMTLALGGILNMTVETYDASFRERSAAGADTLTRVLPIGKIILSRKADDGDDSVMDFAQGTVMEGVIASLIPGAPEVGGQYGPLSYLTGAADLNPGSVTAWAVDSGLPRKHVEYATAVIDSGITS